MSEPVAVAAQRETQASASSELKQSREMSTIDFPYNDLDDALTVAKAVHKLGGDECRMETLAGELGHETVKSGGFRQKVASAHTFGLTATASGMVMLTPLGHKIVDGDQERIARVDAFLTVPLYLAIYEDFKNSALPPNSGLEAKMVALGVSAKQKEKARQVFQRAAKQAGFFAYGASKLVYPALGKQESRGPNNSPSEAASKPKTGGGGGNDGGGDDGNQSLIDGLLKVLPKAGFPWSLESQRKWLQTAAANFAYAYNGTEETRSIKVSIEND